uniref:Uncharacterized protein n=1 Tax=Arundo donax TaxID=35708 RepID=A0A0A8Z9A8_ARUDO
MLGIHYWWYYFIGVFLFT